MLLGELRTTAATTRKECCSCNCTFLNAQASQTAQRLRFPDTNTAKNVALKSKSRTTWNPVIRAAIRFCAMVAVESCHTLILNGPCLMRCGTQCSSALVPRLLVLASSLSMRKATSMAAGMQQVKHSLALCRCSCCTSRELFCLSHRPLCGVLKLTKSLLSPCL